MSSKCTVDKHWRCVPSAAYTADAVGSRGRSGAASGAGSPPHLEDAIGEARTRLALGELRRIAGDPAGAREHWQAALVLFEQLDVPEREEALTRLA